MGLQSTELRLATYGSLAPGSVNAGQVADIPGTWSRGTVRGHLLEGGWGSAVGYPGVVLDPDGDEVDVWVLTSDVLAGHLPRLDAFEGDGYVRVLTTVHGDEGTVEAWIYVLAEEPTRPEGNGVAS